ncbi:MAG: NAD-dependent dihydropyrimidine dehydrogenase subunit PreA [Spirochaetia bacterium]|nr:NAD-dependent dihydropyrimidine dehydrogenase subunit PreA [Spirochaetia bacterium]
MRTLETSILGIKFQNPFILASAPPTASIRSIDMAFTDGWGGAVLKTIKPDTLEIVDASPRFAVLKDKKSIIGFQNIEMISHKPVEEWCEGIRYLKKKHPAKVIIASIMAPVVKEEWQNLVRQLNNTPADAFELNFSCPNGMPEQNMGMAIGVSAETSAMITSWVKEVAEKPVFVKLTPNVTDIIEISKAVEKAGADGFSAINTVNGFMGIDLDTMKPRMNVSGKTLYGGCSGLMVQPIGLRCVSQLENSSSLPILGIGGISTWKDAVEYILMGANAVQICTAVMLNGYSIINNLKKGLLEFMEEKNFSSIDEMTGLMAGLVTNHEDLDKSKIVYPKFDSGKCMRCGKCVTICNESGYNALEMTADGIRLSEDKCQGCSLCKYVCHNSAIEL